MNGNCGCWPVCTFRQLLCRLRTCNNCTEVTSFMDNQIGWKLGESEYTCTPCTSTCSKCRIFFPDAATCDIGNWNTVEFRRVRNVRHQLPECMARWRWAGGTRDESDGESLIICHRRYTTRYGKEYAYWSLLRAAPLRGFWKRTSSC